MKRVVSTLASLTLAAAASAQIQAQKLVASDSESSDRFGSSVSVDGGWAIVGAPEDDDIAYQSGAAYVYHRNGAGWIETQKLKASDPSSGAVFGFAVAISGTVAVLGAYHDSSVVYDAGSAYVFDLVGGLWVQTAKIWASDASPTAHFGYSVAISQDRLLIAARDDSEAAYTAGAAYVYDRVGSTWVEVAKLIASDAAAFDNFADEVALFGDSAIVGCPACDGPGVGAQGAAYIFEYLGGTWQQTAKLVASDPVVDLEYFGTSVAIEGDRALVSATGHDHWGVNAGAVYAFERQGASWVETQELHAADADPQDSFGIALALSGQLCLIAASADEELGFNSGSAYAFSRSAGGWTQSGKLLARDGQPSDAFGASVALSGATAVVGTPLDDDACPSSITCNSGSAYVFELAPDAVQYGHCASAAPCANDDPHGGCVNSTGRGAILAAGGSSSVASDELVLEARDLPPDKSAIVFMGGGQAQVPLGDGLRVVTTGGVGLRRFPMQTSDAEGWLAFGPGIAGLTQGLTSTSIAAGSVWNFQCWYRDPAGPCANATNLTNGVQVAFTP